MSDPTPSSPPPPLPPAGELHSTPPPPAGEFHSKDKGDIVRDVCQWRRKKLSVLVLVVATATWVVLKVYDYNLIPVAAWVGMAISVSLFSWASILRLMGKETPSLSGLEISEPKAIEMGNSIRAWIEEGIRWMFRVGAEREWFVFAGAVAALWLFSYLARFTDLLTLLYTGIVVGITVQPMYMKYEHKIKEYKNRIRVQCESLYDMINERVVKKAKNMAVGEKKEKKIE